MKVVFAGTPQFALPTLQKIHEDTRHSIVAVLTNRDAGRGRTFTPSPVKIYAQSKGIALLQPERLNTELRSRIADLRPDILVVAAYGKIFGPKFLALFPRGGVNLHPSLLPKHRGPSPISASILAGDSRSGISIQYLAEKMDAGDILMQEPFPIRKQDNAEDLEIYCSKRGAELMIATLDRIEEGRQEARPQEEAQASYSKKIRSEDSRLNWQDSADNVHRMIRAYYPHAHTTWNGKRLNILEADVQNNEPTAANELLTEMATETAPQPGTVIAVDKKAGIMIQTSEGILLLRRLQLHTRPRLLWKDFINGHAQFIRSVLL